MATHKTIAGKFLALFGDIFHKSTTKLWDSLSPEEQASIKNGSGIINVINLHLQDAPAAVIEAFQSEFPAIDLTALEGTLIQLCNVIGLQLPTIDIDSAIVALQTYLKSKEGTTWQWASSALAELVSVILSPTTIFQKISVLIQYAYDTFIKAKP